MKEEPIWTDLLAWFALMLIFAVGLCSCAPMARMDAAGNVTVMTGFLSTVQGFSGSAKTKAGQIAWSVQNSDAATGPVNLVTAIGTAVMGVHTADNLVKTTRITAQSNTNQALIAKPGTVLTNTDSAGNVTQTLVPTVLPTPTKH